MKFFEMHSFYRILGFLCVLCASVVNGFALDREAFTITNYDLKVQVEPEQHRLGARGKITLRNDTPTPQKIAVLQVSSSLDWRSVKAGDKAVQFVTQPYTSDIDHTGGLSEAIVTLPQAILPQGTIELEIAYEGTITLDATRLTRIDTPVEAASSTDWDQISPGFTAVRGVGNVAWYPIATEVANLSEGNSLFEVLGRWKSAGVHVHNASSHQRVERRRRAAPDSRGQSGVVPGALRGDGTFLSVERRLHVPAAGPAGAPVCGGNLWNRRSTVGADF